MDDPPAKAAAAPTAAAAPARWVELDVLLAAVDENAWVEVAMAEEEEEELDVIAGDERAWFDMAIAEEDCVLDMTPDDDEAIATSAADS
jgi:hypothetical protein